MSTGTELESETSSSETDWPNPAYAWYMTLLLMVLYMFSFLDRTIIVLLIEPIKRDMHLTDTHISLLYGLAFAIFYTLMGIPIARLADSKNRRTLIAVGVVTWSVMTALCGLAKNFGQLFAARIGVGVGEAALSPAAYSLISDSFPEEKRARAMSVYTMGIYLGVGVAMLLGGLIVDFAENAETISLPLVGELYAWQLTFLIVGAPGLIFAPMVMALREPRRQGVAPGVTQGIPFREAIGWFSQRKRFYLSFYLAMGCLTLYAYSLTAWTPSFFIRTHGWSTLEVSRYYGLTMLAFGPAGILVGGLLASIRARRGDELANARMATFAFLGLLIPAATMTLVDSAWVSLGIVAIIKFVSGLPLGVAMAAVHEVTPNRLRAQAAAFYLFILNIVGLGTGPTIVALLTDYAFGDPSALRYSLAIVGVCACTAGLLLSIVATRQLRILKQESGNAL
jgi:MFS family permease